MKIFTETIGNIHTDGKLSEAVKGCNVEYLNLDQWTAQKSRFMVKGDKGTDCAVSLKRNKRIMDGDVLEYDSENGLATIAKVELSPVMVIDLSRLMNKDKRDVISACVELGHAIGNQHWPAVVKDTEVYIPLTVDRKVMESVMETHHFDDITCSFKNGVEIIPYLAPHEIRRLFGGATQEAHSHHH